MKDDTNDADASTRDVLRAAGAVDVAPPVDLARDAVGRIRGRKRATGNLNDFFRIVHHLFRGLSKILGSPPPDDEPRTARK